MAEDESVRTSWILIFLLLALGLTLVAVRGVGGSILPTVLPALL